MIIQRLLLVLMILLSSFEFCLANEKGYQGEVSFTKINGNIELGSFINASLKAWPAYDIAEDAFEELEGKYILDGFYVYKVLTSVRSPNNEDVLTAKMILIPTNSMQLTEFHFIDLDDRKFPFKIKGISQIEKEQSPLKEYSYFNDQVKMPFVFPVKIVVFAGLLVSLLFWFLFLPRYKKKKAEQNQIKQRNAQKALWLELFENVKTREEIEKIYKSRTEWMALIPDQGFDQNVAKMFDEFIFKSSLEESEIDELKHRIKDLKERISGV